MLIKLTVLRRYLYDKGLKKDAEMLDLLIKHSEIKEESINNAPLSIIDLIGNYETGVVIKDKKPQHVINYSEDHLGNDFTDDDEELNKKAIGLTDVPYGSPDGQYSRRPGPEYEQQDEEVGQRFFGGEDNVDTEESGPPANIERCEDKTINIPVKTEFEDFFSFLNSVEW